jgi:hypothetical protein
MNRLSKAVLALVSALALAGCYLGPAHAQGALLADPCATGPCKPSGLAAGVTIPLPVQPGHFAGAKFDLRVLMDRRACGKGARPGDRCLVQVNGHSNYALGLPITFVRSDGRVLTAPAGMTTDLASIPRVAWSLLPPDGPWAYGAAIHDDCYRTRGSFVWAWPHSTKTFVGLEGPPLTRADCDETFRQTMVALRVEDWKRVVIFEAVRVGGSQGWGS